MPSSANLFVAAQTMLRRPHWNKTQANGMVEREPKEHYMEPRGDVDFVCGAGLSHSQWPQCDICDGGQFARLRSGPAVLVSSATLSNNNGLGALVVGSNSSAQQPITSLPGSTYTVTAQYNGDGINGPSKSQPVSVKVGSLEQSRIETVQPGRQKMASMAMAASAGC